jgi:hypothetical protein
MKIKEKWEVGIKITETAIEQSGVGSYESGASVFKLVASFSYS